MSDFNGFPDITRRFLGDLAANNTKTWFDANRASYDAGYVEPAKAFVAALGPKLRQVSPTIDYEPRVNGSLFRINRDVRFSKDKTPYKAHLDLWFWEGARRGWDTPGFFFRLLPDELIVGAGMHQFQPPQLEAFRKAVLDPKLGAELAKVLDAVRQSGPYQIGGATRKTVPRGFDATHDRAELLKHEGLWAELVGPPPKEIRSAAFVDWCAGHFAKMVPISKWLLTNLPSGTAGPKSP